MTGSEIVVKEILDLAVVSVLHVMVGFALLVVQVDTPARLVVDLLVVAAVGVATHGGAVSLVAIVDPYYLIAFGIAILVTVVALLVGLIVTVDMSLAQVVADMALTVVLGIALDVVVDNALIAVEDTDYLLLAVDTKQIPVEDILDADSELLVVDNIELLVVVVLVGAKHNLRISSYVLYR